MDEIQNTAPIAEPQNIEDLMKLLAEKPEGFAISEDDAEPAEPIELEPDLVLN